MITFKAGTTFSAVVQRKVDSATPFDITNTEITSRLSHRGWAFSLEVEVLDAAQGLFQVKASASETANWPSGTLSWDITYDDGGVVTTIPEDTFIPIRVSKRVS